MEIPDLWGRAQVFAGAGSTLVEAPSSQHSCHFFPRQAEQGPLQFQDLAPKKGLGFYIAQICVEHTQLALLTCSCEAPATETCLGVWFGLPDDHCDGHVLMPLQMCFLGARIPHVP